LRGEAGDHRARHGVAAPGLRDSQADIDSMLISYSHSFIFFHVAKAAGVSIRHALAPYALEPPSFFIRRPPREIDGTANPLYAIWCSSLTHATARQTQRALPEEFRRFYKFAFVRNPWDWHVSMYHFLLKETGNPRHRTVKALGSFRNYLEWVVGEDKPFPKGAPKLQKGMLIDTEGRIALDAIGRFETLARDFAAITAKLGISAALPRLNDSQHGPYQDYYDAYSKTLVAEHFAADIDLFEYSFS